MLALQGHLGPVRALAYSPDGRVLASGSDDRTIRVWNLERGREIATLTGHNYWVRAVAFSPDDQRLASGRRSWRGTRTGSAASPFLLTARRWPRAETTRPSACGTCVPASSEAHWRATPCRSATWSFPRAETRSSRRASMRPCESGTSP